MTQEEYEKLINTINEIDSDRNSEAGNDSEDGENELVSDGEIVCNIDFKELEKASSGLKNLNQKLLLRPIQIDDEDVMSKLSKSARKKLRRRERKREMENLVQNQSSGKNSSSKNSTGNTSVQGKNSKHNKSKMNNDSIKGKDVLTVLSNVDKPKKCSKHHTQGTNETSKTGIHSDNSILPNKSQSGTQNISQDSKVLKRGKSSTKSSNTKISENQTPNCSKQSEIQLELSKSEAQTAGKEPGEPKPHL
jgi:hypothetical protein